PSDPHVCLVIEILRDDFARFERCYLAVRIDRAPRGVSGRDGTGSAHGELSFSLWLSAAVSLQSYTFLRSRIAASVASENGGLPSKLCSTIPSRRSPSDMSQYSARPFSTLRRDFSMRTPVWVRSTVFMPGSVLPWYMNPNGSKSQMSRDFQQV